MMLRLFIIVGFVLGSPELFAQESDISEPALGKGQSELRVCCLGKWEGAELFLRGGKGTEVNKMQHVELLDMGYSSTLRYTKGKPVEFFRKTGKEDPLYEVALSVKVPESIRKPLVLFIPQDKKMACRVFDLDPSKFPFGACQVVNLSAAELRVALNNDLRPLKSKQAQMFSPAKEKAVRSWLRVGMHGRKKLLFSTMMMRRSQKRMLVFLVPGKDANGKGVMKTRMLVDYKQG